MIKDNGIIAVVGHSWVGKSSLTSQISQRSRYLRISIGDLLREFVRLTLLDLPAGSLTQLELQQKLIALIEQRVVLDNQVHLSTSMHNINIRDRDFEVVTIMAGLGPFHSFYEQAIAQLIKTHSQHSKVVIDGREKAVELMFRSNLRPFAVLLTCPAEIRVKRHLLLMDLPTVPENIALYLSKLKQRETEDLIHTPSFNANDSVHLVLNTAELTIEEEYDLVIAQSETYFAKLLMVRSF